MAENNDPTCYLVTHGTTLMKHVFLIDGSGFIFRAYHALPGNMTNPEGTVVNAVYGFTAMVLKLLEKTDADHIAVIFDRARKTFRSDIYPDYKAHRPPPPDDLIPQFELVREATRAMGLKAVDMEGFEADDLIATYARQAREAGADVTIVSSDKDLMQLVTDKVTMMDAMKNKIIGIEQVVEKFGVGPDRVIDVQALSGDSADNVPGVEGIGVKTAAQLINEYGDLEAVLANAENIKQPKLRERLMTQADNARVSKELVTLRDDVPVDVALGDFDVPEPDVGKLLDFLRAQAFKSLISKVEHLGMSVGDNGNAKIEKIPVEKAEYVLVQTEAAPPPPKVPAEFRLIAKARASQLKEFKTLGVYKEGIFRTRLARRGVWCAAAIRYEPPRDPETGEFLDRPYAMVPYINDEPRDGADMEEMLERIHIWGEPILQDEYDYLVAMYKWAKENAPNSLEANPDRGADIDKMKALF